ncbi:hypothetical protein STEG23_031627, partial [Scotinomys teguina]
MPPQYHHCRGTRLWPRENTEVSKVKSEKQENRSPLLDVKIPALTSVMDRDVN